VTEVVAWAASNGDRSENADYQYGKRRLRPDRLGGFAFSGSESKLRKWWTRKLRERGKRPREHLRRDRALCQCRGSRASGKDRGYRRSRSRPQPHQLGVASGARVAEVGSGRQRLYSQAPAVRNTWTCWKCVTSAFQWKPFREPPGSESSSKGSSRRPHSN